MSTEMPDPTGELKRQHRKLRISRTGDVVNGIIELILGGAGIVFFLGLLGYFLWNHSTDWFRYGMSLLLLCFCASLIWIGRLSLQTGKKAITSAELTRAKQAYRRELQQAAQGKLPLSFSKRSRYYYLVMVLLFGGASGLGWYKVATSGATADALSLLITSMVVLVYFLVRFLISFAGKTYQRESGAELRQIWQAGEFAPADEHQEK